MRFHHCSSCKTCIKSSTIMALYVESNLLKMKEFRSKISILFLIISFIYLGEIPQLLVRPPALTHVQSGATFVLSCKATSQTQTSITWQKDSRTLTANTTHLRVFQSGQFLERSQKLPKINNINAHRKLCLC